MARILKSADTGLTFNPKIYNVTRRDVFQLYLCENDELYYKSSFFQTSTVFGTS